MMFRITRIPQVDAVLGRDGPMEDWEAVRRFVRRSNEQHVEGAIRYLFCRMLGFPDVPLDLCQETLEKLQNETSSLQRYDLSCVGLYPWCDAMGRRQQTRDTSRSQSRRGLDRRRERKLLSIQSWDDLIGDELFHKAVRKTQMTLELLSNVEPPTSFLHKLLIVGLPNFVVYLAARLFPEQLRARDSAGRLPIHIVAERATEYLVYRNNVWYFHEDLQDDGAAGRQDGIVDLLNKPTPLQLLCHLYPDAGHQTDYSSPTSIISSAPNRREFLSPRGYTPLESFLYTIGRHDALSIGTSRLANSRMAEMLQDLEALICIAPQVLETRHPQSMLFPFMVPAQFYDFEFGVPPCGDESRASQLLLLSMSYALLRANPNVLVLLRNQDDF